MRKWSAYLGIILLTLIPPTAGYAQNVHTLYTGHVKYIYLSLPTNEAFRVTIDTTMANCSYNFGYQNTSDGNYQAFASLLTSAAFSGRAVNLWVTTDSNGFCHIDEAQVAF